MTLNLPAVATSSLSLSNSYCCRVFHLILLQNGSTFHDGRERNWHQIARLKQIWYTINNLIVTVFAYIGKFKTHKSTLKVIRYDLYDFLEQYDKQNWNWKVYLCWEGKCS